MTEKPVTISYYVHEAEIARSEQHSRRWMIAALIAFVALVLSNTGWIIYENQYADEVYTQEVTQTTDQGGGNTNFYRGDYNGNADSQDNN